MVAATSRMKQAESRAQSSGESGGDSRVFDWPAIGVLQTMATATVFTALKLRIPAIVHDGAAGYLPLKGGGRRAVTRRVGVNCTSA